jgi:hypothetical protein
MGYSQSSARELDQPAAVIYTQFCLDCRVLPQVYVAATLTSRREKNKTPSRVNNFDLLEV